MVVFMVSKMTTRRGRMVREGNTLIDVHESGSVHAKVGERSIDFTESEFLDFVELSQAVIRWEDAEE
jgi:hypothetical protein